MPAVSTASAGGTAALQHAVLVLALLGSAAVLLVQQVQLNAFVQLGEKGQQLLTAAALATFVAGVAAGLSSRRRPASVVLLDTPAPAAVPVAAAAAAAAAAPPQDLTGVWAKDKELSDSMEEVGSVHCSSARLVLCGWARPVPCSVCNSHPHGRPAWKEAVAQPHQPTSALVFVCAGM